DAGGDDAELVVEASPQALLVRVDERHVRPPTQQGIALGDGGQRRDPVVDRDDHDVVRGDVDVLPDDAGAGDVLLDPVVDPQDPLLPLTGALRVVGSCPWLRCHVISPSRHLTWAVSLEPPCPSGPPWSGVGQARAGWGAS